MRMHSNVLLLCGVEAPCYRCPPSPLSSSQSPEAAAAGHWAPVELLNKVLRSFAKISLSLRRPLLGSSPG